MNAWLEVVDDQLIRKPYKGAGIRIEFTKGGFNPNCQAQHLLNWLNRRFKWTLLD